MVRSVHQGLAIVRGSSFDFCHTIVVPKLYGCGFGTIVMFVSKHLCDVFNAVTNVMPVSSTCNETFVNYHV